MRASTAQERRRRRHAAAIALALLLLLAGSVTLATTRPWSKVTNSSSGARAGSERFEGMGAISLPSLVSEDHWWTRVDVAPPPPRPKPDHSVAELPGDVLFAVGSDELSPSAGDAVDQVAAVLRGTAGSPVVSCFSSVDGSHRVNQELSERRADRLATAIEEAAGLPDGRITWEGFGESRQLSNIDPTTPTGMALNRRCEIRLRAAP